MKNFTDLASLDSAKYVVATGLSIDDMAETLSQMNEHFAESKLLLNGCKIVSIEKIGQNIKGDAGRTDWLLELSTSVADVSPLKRIMDWPWVKWLEDFIANYKDDYIQEV